MATIIECDQCHKQRRSERGNNTYQLFFENDNGDPERISVESNEDGDHGLFCSFACLAAWATNKAVAQSNWFDGHE